jgi:hypothetical protein
VTGGMTMPERIELPDDLVVELGSDGVLRVFHIPPATIGQPNEPPTNPLGPEGTDSPWTTLPNQ